MKGTKIGLVSFVSVLTAILCLAIAAYPVAADSPLTVVHVAGEQDGSIAASMLTRAQDL
jgi:hypothetical protein